MSFDEHVNISDDLSLFGNVDPLIGKILNGRWQVLEFLGEGSMSAVYKAHDTITGDNVAIKFLHQHLVTNAKNLKRFEQKAKAATSLIHPCIAHMLAFNLSPEGEIFLVIEFLQGESLEDLLAKTGHLSIEQSIGIFKQACDGLEFAHEQDVLHRDLKPSNLMLLDRNRTADEVKLVDFGVAKLLSDETDDVKSSGYITRSREVFGSPMYMSPEQCMGRRLDARSDIYSLACVMYETLTGKPPFVGKNVLETAYKHMNEKPRSITADTVASRAMNRMEAIIFRCLEKDPNMRYQSMSQLRSDLEILLRASDIEWNASAIALRKATKGQRRSGRKLPSIKTDGILSKVSKEAAIVGALGLVFLVVLGVWGISFITTDNYSNGPSFNDDVLWNTEVPPPREDPNYDAQLTGAKRELERADRENGKESKHYQQALMRIAVVEEHSGHFDKALEHYNEAVKMADNPDLYTASGSVYQRRAMCQFLSGQYDDAERDASMAIERGKERGLAGSKLLATPLNIVGEVYSRRRELDKAADTYDNLYTIYKPMQTEDPSSYATTAARLADIYRRQNRLPDSERIYRSVLETINGFRPSGFALKAHYGLGLVLEQENHPGDALQQFREADKIVKAFRPQPTSTTDQRPKTGLASSIKRHMDACLWKTNPLEAFLARFGVTKNTDDSAPENAAPRPVPSAPNDEPRNDQSF